MNMKHEKNISDVEKLKKISANILYIKLLHLWYENLRFKWVIGFNVIYQQFTAMYDSGC